MAIIVDKEQKRKEIALACKTLFIEKGINKLTIAEIAKTAGVGKGTIYEYFSNKEEIVFEIVGTLMQIHNAKKEQKIQNAEGIQEKMKIFFSFFYDEQEQELRSIYKEFISISLLNPSAQIVAFNTLCFESYFAWFESLIQEGIQNQELIPESAALARGLFSISEGLFISTEITENNSSMEQELEQFFSTLFALIEVK